MLCRIGTLQIQPRTHVVDHSDYAAPTRQPELLSIMQVRNISALLKDVDHQVDNRRNVRRVELLQLLFGGGGGGGGFCCFCCCRCRCCCWSVLVLFIPFFSVPSSILPLLSPLPFLIQVRPSLLVVVLLLVVRDDETDVASPDESISGGTQ